MALSRASMDGLSALSECRTQETYLGISGGFTEGAPLGKRSGGTGVLDNTKQLHELRATGIISDEECATQLQNLSALA